MDLYSELRIFIPTYRRAGKVRTLKFLPESALDNTRLVVRQDDYEIYKKMHPSLHILVLPPEVNNLSQTRNFIISTCKTRYCMMLDDDLEFKFRPDLDKWNLKPMPASMFNEMAELMVARMFHERIAHCAVSPVEGHSHYMALWNYLQRYMRAYIFDLRVVNQFRYKDEVNGCEDFDMALQLITAGHPSLVCYMFAQTHESSNAKGGLSDYRDIAYHNRAMEQLKARWPKYIRLVPKKTKKSWNGLPRLDVRVAWKQAFQDNSPKYYCNVRDNTNKPLIKPQWSLCI
jgi:hypothetical protein